MTRTRCGALVARGAHDARRAGLTRGAARTDWSLLTFGTRWPRRGRDDCAVRDVGRGSCVIAAEAEGKKSPASTELSPLWMAMSAEEKKEASA